MRLQTTNNEIELQMCVSSTFITNLFINNQMYSIPTRWEDVMLQWCRPVLSVHHMAGLRMKSANPLSELPRVRNCGGEKYVVHIVRQQDESL